jgi:hypothetical protein
VSDPFNNRVSVTVANDGRFTQGAFPDPTNGLPTAGSYTTLYGWPSPGTSFTTLRVDGNDQIFGSGGSFSQPPTEIDSSTNQSTWVGSSVTVQQTLRLVTNPDTGRPDTAAITYRVTNHDTVTHSIGVRTMFDTDVNNNDGAPFRLPAGPVTTERDLTGAAIPDTFQVFANLNDSQHIAAARLAGAGATTPDRLVIGQWPGLYSSPWDYTTNPSAPITRDSAYAAYWQPTALAPGAARSVTTYYGLSDVTVDLNPPLALGVTGTTALAVSGGGYTPNPFTVTATVADAGAVTATGVALTLQLPPGLHTSSTNPVPVGALSPGGAEGQASWLVYADLSSSNLNLTYSVTASATNAASKTVSRAVAVPAAAGTLLPCPNVVFMAVMGSGEAFVSESDLSPSSTLSSVYGAFKTKTGAATVKTMVINYPALPVDTLSAGLREANTPSALTARLGSNVYTYLNGESAGVTALGSAVNRVESQCGSTKIALAGYSQGAMVIHDWVNTPNRGPHRNIVAIALVADPERVDHSSSLNFGDAAFYSRNLIGSHGVCAQINLVINCAAPNRLSDISSAFVRRTVNVCQSYDIVCDTGTVAANWPVNTQEGRNTLVNMATWTHVNYSWLPATKTAGKWLGVTSNLPIGSLR